MTPVCLGRPTIDGKKALGASSPANPALHIPDPLSTTNACTSSDILKNKVFLNIHNADMLLFIPPLPIWIPIIIVISIDKVKEESRSNTQDVLPPATR